MVVKNHLLKCLFIGLMFQVLSAESYSADSYFSSVDGANYLEANLGDLKDLKFKMLTVTGLRR